MAKKTCTYKTVYIQQDNAPCHVSLDDEELRREASSGGFDVHFTFQHPNSHALNVFGFRFFFFFVIQSL